MRFTMEEEEEEEDHYVSLRQPQGLFLSVSVCLSLSLQPGIFNIVPFSSFDCLNPTIRFLNGTDVSVSDADCPLPILWIPLTNLNGAKFPRKIPNKGKEIVPGLSNSRFFRP